MKELFIVILLTCFVACEYQIPELPPETQIGEGTFGCLVNGELVVTYWDGDYRPFVDDNPHAVYNPTADRLQIIGYGQNNQVFKFTVDHPEANRIAPIDTVVYYPSKSYGNYYYGGTNLGEITLTRFDLAKRIVSGTFSFVGHIHYIDTGIVDYNDFVTVTMGRFDIILNINN